VIRTALLILSSIALTGQSPTPLQFEVATVRLISDGIPPGTNTTLQLSPQGFNANYAALRQLAGIAYNIQRVRVEGGPAWMDSDQYKIAAKAEDPDTSDNAEKIREMLRTLLAERFKLVVHRETKQLAIYSLAIAKDGSKLEEVKDDPPRAPSFAAEPGKSAMIIVCRNMPMAGLVNYLANVLGSPVHDDTGLKGRYNFTLEAVRPGAPQATDSAPDLFEAVQAQLGLKLDGKKGPVEVVIVDHAEKATAQ
jgi:uncharacterized protein (TIGR03435 family)